MSARASVLLVVPEVDLVQETREALKFEYAPAEVESLLGSRGWHDLEIGAPDVLEHGARLRRHDCVVVTWIWPRYWRAGWLRGLRAYDGVVALEGPVPPMLEGFARFPLSADSSFWVTEESGHRRAEIGRRGRILSTSFPLLSFQEACEPEALDSFLASLRETLARYDRTAAITTGDGSSNAVRVDDATESCVFQVTSAAAVDVVGRPELVRKVGLRGRAEPLEWRADTAHAVRVNVSLRVGESAELEVGRRRPPRYEELSARLPPDTPDVPLDADYQLPRVSTLWQVVGTFAPELRLEDATVVDVGCGFGPTTLALHLAERPRRSIGVDLNESSIRRARGLVEDLEVQNVRFEHADMAATDKVVSGADLIVSANAVYFLTSRRRYRETFASFYRALRPGGALVILSPNKLHYKEAVTGLNGVQFLPGWLADMYARKRGVRAGYRDIRLPSPFELRRWARRAGFEEVEVVDPYRLTADETRRYFKPRFYLVATKPPG